MLCLHSLIGNVCSGFRSMNLLVLSPAATTDAHCDPKMHPCPDPGIWFLLVPCVRSDVQSHASSYVRRFTRMVHTSTIILNTLPTMLPTP